jgi:hypothetical protein
MLVKPFSAPSIRNIAEPMITTIVSTATRNTTIFSRLARSARDRMLASPRKRTSLSTRNTRSRRNPRITMKYCEPTKKRLR